MKDLGEMPTHFGHQCSDGCGPESGSLPATMIAERRFDHPASPQTTLIVTGMHRSGTSFLTECLSVAGWQLPKDRGAPSHDNPRGHFESAGLVALNDNVLDGLASRWTRFSPLSADEIDRIADDGYFDQLNTTLVRAFADGQAPVVKDPRIALLSPLWKIWAERQTARVATVVALRRPQAVAASLLARDGLPRDIALLSWIAHTLGALDLASSGQGMIVPFPSWVSRPESLVERLTERELLPPTPLAAFRERVAAICMPDAIHCHYTSAEAGAATSEIEELADELFEMANDWSEANATPAKASIGQMRQEFDRVREVASSVERHGQATLATTSARLAAAVAAARAAENSTAELVARNVDLQRRLNDAERERILAAERLEASIATDQAAYEALAAADARYCHLRSELDEAVGQLALAHERTEAACAERDQAKAEAARITAHGERVAEQLRIARLRAHRQARDRQLLTDSLIGTAERLHQAQSALADASERLASAESEREVLRAALRDLDARHASVLAANAASQVAARSMIDDLTLRLRHEELTVAKPIYRRAYRAGGRVLRRFLTDRQMTGLKRRIPGPEGIPPGLADQMPDWPRAGAKHQTVLTHNGGTLPDIYVLSIINWDFRTQRPQHLAREWARRGHRVFYVEMESDLSGQSIRSIEDNLYVVRLGTTADGLIPTYRGTPDNRQVLEWTSRMLSFFEQVAGTATAHVVIQHPYWWPFARLLPKQYTLTFDCMDEISGFSNTEAHTLLAEREMIAEADHMIVSSQYLMSKHATSRQVTLVRNAADVGHFLGVAPHAVDVRSNTAPDRATTPIRVGYVGAIAEWFDVDLVAQVARNAPEMEFHLYGAVTNPAAMCLGSLPNVMLHGEIPYSRVPAVLSDMDVMTIPFRLLPIIQACDPVKFYEYAAAGKPVVATRLPELDRAGDLVARVDDADMFVDALREALIRGKDPHHVAALQDYARANSWVERGEAMLAAMQARRPLVSVIILSYGDPTLTLATLQSLIGNGPTYPALEIIVVDNGSPAAAVTAIKDRMHGIPRARLIENGRNLGFAGGNNIGINAASGDYVLLLNNDTFVAPGAIAALVDHLHRNPRIGVICPMTNNIGNEARIEVQYADMTEMLRAAWSVTTGYRGQWTEIGTVAYFCAMFRRADFDTFGLLDEAFGRGMFEDDDHCARIRAKGFVCALAEDAFVHHHLSASFDALGQEAKQALFEKNRAIFEARWGTWTPHRYRESRPAPLHGVA